MKINPDFLFRLETSAVQQRGVFTTQDLENLFLTYNPIALQRKIAPFLKAKILQRFCRGFYVFRKFENLPWLSQRLCPHSAISFGNILAKKLIIGSIPKKAVYAVKIGKSRTYRSHLGNIVHLGFSSPQEITNLWFGYEAHEDGIFYANKEKAFLDTLYFYQLGHRFSFNIYSDIHLDKLDMKVIADYLTHYKNPKFRKFVEGVIHG